MINQETVKQKRQYFHQLLLALGEERYKEVIVEAHFGVCSTKELSEKQLDILISDAKKRLGNNQQPKQDPESSKMLRMWRNKCLLVLNERGIIASPKDWSAVNQELSKKQFQWVLSPAQLASGITNHKGLYAFRKVDDLKKLFKQLCSIRDNEQIKAKELKELALKN
ncbi:hypothetical protein [Carboxylicivirga linearis]|uniref:Regulatory protein GemA n=1 Tax=Carboxylicivirga linearis TaxID=1628157 RepID=A0ABS5K004_9BACT|nr:hypothetical protein [Carboxylicivirga linearis]MBS2100414.1 hypothetical protein [Carboxylicivirga linearis]